MKIDWKGLLKGGLAGVSDAMTDSDVAVQRLEQRRKEKKALSDEQRKNALSLYDQAITGIREKMGSVDPKSPEYANLKQGLEKAVHGQTMLYDPRLAPGAYKEIAGLLEQGAPGKEPDKYQPLGKPYQDPNDKQWYQTFRDPAGNVSKRAMPEGFTAPAASEKPITKLMNVKGKGWSYVTYVPGGKVLAIMQGAPAPRTMAGTERTSTTTDPFGVKTTTASKTQPLYHGEVSLEIGQMMSPETAQIAEQAPGLGESPTPTPAQPTTSTPSPVPSPPKTAGEAKKAIAPPAGRKQIDAQGHIPADAKVNPMLKEAANQLLDGKALKDLAVPQRDRQAAAELARQYGWAGEGVMTPMDKVRLKESTSIIQQLSKSDSLSVFDDPVSRQKIAQVIQNPEKRGTIGQFIQNLAASGLNPREQEFVRLYIQSVGRISGLSQLVRSGRPTEATIDRLKTELPNPFTTTNSADAREKLKLLQQEIDIALDKGQFKDQAPGEVTDEQFLQNF